MVSSTFRTHAFALRSGEVNITLLEIDHPNLASPARLSTDTVATTHGGNVYVPCPALVQFLQRVPGAIPTARIQVDNTSQLLLEATRSVVQPMPTVTMTVVLASDPNTVEIQQTLFLAQAEITAAQISGELTMAPVDGPFLRRVSPAITPGLF